MCGIKPLQAFNESSLVPPTEFVSNPEARPMSIPSEDSGVGGMAEWKSPPGTQRTNQEANLTGIFPFVIRGIAEGI